MNNNPQGWVLFVVALPAVVVGYVWMLLLCTFRVAEWSSLRFQGAGVLTGRTRAKVAKKWGYSTTAGRGILYHPHAYDETPEIDNRTERHEFVHIKQFEDDTFAAFFAGLLVAALGWWLLDYTAMQGFATWTIIWCHGVARMLTNFVTAVLRYGWKGIYRDTEHERSAYAQTDLIRLLAAHGPYGSWDEMRDKVREEQEGLLR